MEVEGPQRLVFPDEVFNLIFMCLEDAADLARVGRTCKKFYTLSSQNVQWKRFADLLPTTLSKQGGKRPFTNSSLAVAVVVSLPLKDDKVLKNAFISWQINLHIMRVAKMAEEQENLKRQLRERRVDQCLIPCRQVSFP